MSINQQEPPAPGKHPAPFIPPIRSEELSQSRAPLVIGVVGAQNHGSLDDGAMCMASQVQAKVAEYRKLLPHTPFLLLSPMKEVLEKAAVEKCLRKDSDAELVVVLPYPAAKQHVSIGKEHESKTRFLDLTDKVGLVDGVASVLTRTFVARRCQILMTVGQDGTEAVAQVQQMIRVKQTGEVEDVIRPAVAGLGGNFPDLFGQSQDDLLEASDTGPVHVFPDGKLEVPDESKDDPDHYIARFKEILEKNLDHFNRQATTMSARTQAKWEENRSYLLKDDDARALPDELKTLRNAFATADTLANLHQGWVKWCVRGALVLLFIAVLAFSIFAHILSEPWSFVALGFYLFFLAAADILYLFVFGHQDRQNLYQDYRTLAEGLRVQFAWSLAGISRPAADFYLRKQKNELQWIHEAVKAQGLRAACRDGRPGPRPANALQVLETWVLDQFAYYRKSALRDCVKHLLWSRTAGGLLLASLIGTFGATLFGIIHYRHSLPVAVLCVAFAGPLLAAAVGLWHVISKFKELGEENHRNQQELRQATRYAQRRMPGLYDELALLNIELPDFPRRPKFWLWRVLSFVLWPILGFPTKQRFWWIIATVFLACGVLGGGMLAWMLERIELLDQWLPNDDPCEPDNFVSDWFIVALGLSVAAAALCVWYAEKRAYSEHHKQYRGMRAVFGRLFAKLVGLSAQLRQAKQDNDALAVERLEKKILDSLTRLGREALTEHGDWLLLHRERPLELPRLEI